MSRPSPDDSPLTRSQQRWRLTAPGTTWRRFDDEVVVFDPVSGDTHLVAPRHQRVVERLADGPVSVAVLLDQEHDAGAEDAPACLRAALEALYALDLIEPDGE